LLHCEQRLPAAGWPLDGKARHLAQRVKDLDLLIRQAYQGGKLIVEATRQGSD
jgi:hypothetical protein